MLPVASTPTRIVDAMQGQPTKEYYLSRARECRRLAVATRTESKALFQVLEQRWLALARNSLAAADKR